MCVVAGWWQLVLVRLCGRGGRGRASCPRHCCVTETRLWLERVNATFFNWRSDGDHALSWLTVRGGRARHSSRTVTHSHAPPTHPSSSMATRAATKPIFRASLRSTHANGHSAFIPQCRKLVFEYCDRWPSSANTRTFLLNHLQSVAKENPHVELVVKQRNHKEPIVRGFYSMCITSQSSGAPHNSCPMLRPCLVRNSQ